jgi:hypothetical protein
MDAFSAFDDAVASEEVVTSLVDTISCCITSRPLAITFQSAAKFSRNGEQVGAGLVVMGISTESSLFSRVVPVCV